MARLGSSPHSTGCGIPSSGDEAKRRKRVLFPNSLCTSADQCNPRKVILERQCLTHGVIQQQFPSSTFQLGAGLELGDVPLATGADSIDISETANYLLGVGRADCTGPVAQVPLMGYANPEQAAGGLLTHLYSRAFIVADPGDSRRVVFVSADIGMVSQRVRLEVLERLKSKYGDLYRQDNVILSGTHTHSGPAGYFQYTLFWITSKGLIRPSLNSIVNGIVKSIDIAHENMKRGRLFINRGTVENSQINRSPFSYLANPASERSRYSSNTDKEMVILKMVDEDGQELGLISWFAVHPVSMNNTNHLVNSDNVGYASYLFEQDKNKGMLPGEGSFVAAFASSNLGDVSPNTRGPTCTNTGESCDNPQSSCPVGGAAMCMAHGPGNDMFESTRIIGQNIYSKARELYEKASQEVTGPLSSAHQWVNMSDVSVELNATHTVKTCKPALGHSFAAGTIDGVGAFNFTQGAVEGDPFWDQIRDQLLGEPSNETKACHKPKPILFSTGEMTRPHPWHPDVVDVQIAAIGSLAIVAVPGELTTMSGRRLREAVTSEFDSHGTPRMNVVIAGLCNVYTHYIATYEEYQVQRYEAASTIYGPHTLSAYIQLYRGLARAIATNTTQDLPRGPEPPFFNIGNLTLLPSLGVERAPANKTFGDVLQEVRQQYRVGEVAEVTFVGANPRNSAENATEHNFLTVERHTSTSGTWQVVQNDASWDTRFYWTRGSLSQSNVTIEWHIPAGTEPGTYRIRYFGHYKKRVFLTRTITVPFEGSSSAFEITSP
ncbi:PREDICTED: neutral ceramidase [Lepidothrix coronata]|uniref:Neutral ceramidase n=1 Tax=Lepidothrix coronata TaxID=321398 RepID=A0A6J0IQA6_9PASS|nr:PREDICTED: neutral ceramidase [Lepidothrix coronata]